MDSLPLGAYICDHTGYIRKYNQKAIELWGRAPVPDNDEERFCGAYRLYTAEGIYIPNQKSVTASSLLDGIPVKDFQFFIAASHDMKEPLKL